MTPFLGTGYPENWPTNQPIKTYLLLDTKVEIPYVGLGTVDDWIVVNGSARFPSGSACIFTSQVADISAPIWNPQGANSLALWDCGDCAGDNNFAYLSPFKVVQVLEVPVLKVDILDASKNETTTLKVAKWTNSFNAGPTVKDEFIASDDDKFYVRVNDQSKKGSGKISVKLSTDSAGTNYDDDATEIELLEESTNSGIFISTNMLMVSDNVDDDFTNPTVVADDIKNDRTHKIALGGKVKVQYPNTGTVVGEKEASVPPSLKAVDVNVIILRDKPAASNGVPVVTTTHVSNMWNIVKERYAQVGIAVNYTVSIQDPPSGVDLTDGLLVREAIYNHVLAAEAKALIAAYGTVGNNADIHIFYVNTVVVGEVRPYGSAVADYYYYPSENDYLYNIFINNAVNKPFTAAHELAHLLADDPESNEEFNVLFGPTSTANFPAATKRLNITQESTMRGNGHVQ